MDAVFAILPRYNGGPAILNFKKGVRKTEKKRPVREYCNKEEERSGYGRECDEGEAFYGRNGLRSDTGGYSRDIDFEA